MTDRADRFGWEEGDVVLSQCAQCVNWVGFGRCLAYPDGIPGKILDNEHDHKKPFPGDNGILFRLKPPGFSEILNKLEKEE